MDFFSWLIVLVVMAVICRVLRSKWAFMDAIAYLGVLALFIGLWISDGFWAALFGGFLGAVAVALLFGLGGGTVVHKFGHRYTLTCSNCGYEKLDIIGHTEDGVTTKCKRCGTVCDHLLEH